MWEELRSLQVSGLWLCLGDFNCTLREGERGTDGRILSGRRIHD